MLFATLLMAAVTLPLSAHNPASSAARSSASSTAPAVAARSTSTAAVAARSSKGGTFTVGDGTFLLNGKPFIVKAAELHYPRIPRPYWEHRILMCKALGMNTICIYVFWNLHEQREGQFDFTGDSDVAAFCRLAQKHGMYVIVRPGPYVCAEWEMGGLPWWLLKKKDIRLRERDPYFMERVKIFEQHVGQQLEPLTIQHGGPIIMIQVENEYGSYGEDKPYISEIRDCLRSIYGTGVTLFQCDWSTNFTKNGLDDLVWTMNFGTGANIDQQFRRLGELRPTAPRMCSEYWSGWFDKWGARHETRPAKNMVNGLDQMLSKGISFSLYMTHGGTSFGHWAGANSPGFAPDVTSYDYDAPISEQGLATEKYHLLRTMMQKYADGKLPAIPKAPMGVVTVPEFRLTEFAPISHAIDTTVVSSLKTFEEMNMGWGTMLYSTQLPDIPVSSALQAECHDYAQVFIDDQFVGTINRIYGERSLKLPPVRKGQRLYILVEGMGRINFSRAIKDFKGIVSPVVITAHLDNCQTTWTPTLWHHSAIPDTYATALRALQAASGSSASSPSLGSSASVAPASFRSRGFYRGSFSLKKPGDTFLNLERWGKGQVWVNGHALGRFWSIGPQQTLYIPGCWLKKGQNEIIVLDVVGPRDPVVWGQATPEMNKLQLTKSNKHNDPADKPDLATATPVAVTASGSANSTVVTAAATTDWQTFPFAAPQQGRYLILECLSTQKSNDRLSIAELYLQGPDGRRLNRDSWSVKYATSETDNGNHTGDKAFDLQESTYWQTERNKPFPHLLVIDLGAPVTVRALEYLPRAEKGAPGALKDFRIYLK